MTQLLQVLHLIGIQYPVYVKRYFNSKAYKDILLHLKLFVKHNNTYLHMQFLYKCL